MRKMCSMKLVYNCCSYYCRVTNHSTFGSLEQLFCSWFCVSGVQESLSWALSIGGLESSEYSSESDFQNSIFTWLTVGWELSWGCQCEHLRSPSQHGRLKSVPWQLHGRFGSCNPSRWHHFHHSLWACPDSREGCRFYLLMDEYHRMQEACLKSHNI